MNTLRYAVNNWSLDEATGTIVHLETGKVRRLGEYQIKLLYCLAQHAGQTLSRNELTALVWERRVIGDNSLSNAIHALRAALEDDGKLQRVIKTIPKYGYLLEAEYCQLLEPSPEESSQPERPEVPANLPPQTAPVEPTRDAAPQPAALFAAIKRNTKSLRILLLACLAGLLMSVGSWWYASYLHNSDFTYQEQGKNLYSNILAYRIALTSDSEEDEEFKRFSSVLQKLNQKLIAHDAGMTVYYRTTEQMLNYTFAIQTQCGNQQLVMTLYHWRTDNQKVNTIISRETERVLDEMAECKKS